MTDRIEMDIKTGELLDNGQGSGTSKTLDGSCSL